MPNIVINNYCNLQCPYCFADHIKTDTLFNLSLEEFKETLDFVLRGWMECVGLIGGEPLLHPQFKEIFDLTMETCQKTAGQCVIFTNGIELSKYWLQITEHLNCTAILINCNEPKILGKNIEKFEKTIDLIAANPDMIDNFTFGCNIYLDEQNYDYFWSVIERVHAHHVRVSVTAPGGIYSSWKTDKAGYYQALAPIFLNFVNKAKEHNVHVLFDCGRVPGCLYTEDEQKLISQACNTCFDVLWRCDPVIDLLPGHKAVPCFGNFQPIDYSEYQHINALRHYFFFGPNIDASRQNISGGCKDCQYFNNYACQGGCLAFSDINK